MYKYILKLKKYNDSIQYTYTTRNYIEHSRSSSLLSNSKNKDESLRCSISRSISNIKEYCLCNNFDTFFTLTLKDKRRCNVLFATNKLHKAMRTYKSLFPDFIFLYVFEKQKKGGIHLHAFAKGFGDLKKNNYGFLESNFFARIGYHNLEKIDKVNPFYIIKYISKNPLPELKHRYFFSRGLNKACIEYFHCLDDDFKDFQWRFRSPYCKMVTIKK